MNIGGLKVLDKSGVNVLSADKVDTGLSRLSSQYNTTQYPISMLWDNNDSTFAHTNLEVNPSMLVVLTQSVEASAIQVINRKDCCADRLAGAVLEVFEANGDLIQSQVLDGSVAPTMIMSEPLWSDSKGPLGATLFSIPGSDGKSTDISAGNIVTAVAVIVAVYYAVEAQRLRKLI